MLARFNLFLLGLLLGCSGVYAQAAADSIYRQVIGYNQRLYNGPEYIRTYVNIAGHPFLEKDTMAAATIWFDNIRYDGVPLNYDIARQQVITRGAQIFAIRLVPEKLNAFSLYGRHFRRYDTAIGSRKLQGIYEVLYTGTTSVLAYHYKEVKAATASDEQGRFIPHRRFIVVRNNSQHTVDQPGDLLRVFADRREAVKMLLKQEKLDFRTQPERTLVAAAKLADEK